MKLFLTIFITIFILSCSGKDQPKKQENKYSEVSNLYPRDTLYRVSENEYELGDDFCYVNQRGDTIIPYGRFNLSFTDTIFTYGILAEKSGENYDLLGVNSKGQRLYEVYWFDNGPDYIEEGMFRILRNGKIGFADTTGEIVIRPQYQCAHPFSGGNAKVAFDCKLEKESEHTIMKSDTWFYIDKKGQKLN